MPFDTAIRRHAIATRQAAAASPVLDRIRADAQVWSAVVLWDEHPAGVADAWLDRELARIRGLGFQAVRFHLIQPTYLGHGQWDLTTARRWFAAADRAGLAVIVCAEVFHRPPDALLAEHGVERADFDRGWLDDPRHLAVVRAYVAGFIAPLAGCARAWCVLGEPGANTLDVANPADRRLFADWLQRTYGDLSGLSAAWRVYGGGPSWSSWDAAAAAVDPRTAGEISGVHHARVVYGAKRDLARCLGDRSNARARVLVQAVAEADPGAVIGVGSHQLFINQAKLGWDLGGWASAGHLHTTSIHLSWHFESVRGEVDLPVWLQARATRDYRKSGFSSAFETTGGPVQFSGGYGNHMDAGLMRRLCLAYLAAGNQAMAFWSWNCRPGGWEQGEYGMVGLGGEPMPWAVEAGRIAQAMERWRRELWDEPSTRSVGVVESWDSDAILIAEPERHDASSGIPGPWHSGVAGLHRRALIGAGRALTRAQLDWEYVTTDELLGGLAGCYDTLVLPWHRAVDPALITAVQQFVAAGGRLVVDAQFAFCDHHGRISPRATGSPLASLLGGWIDAIHDGRTGGPTWQGRPVTGFWADLHVTTATILARFDDGRPALLRHAIGAGEVITMALDPALAACAPDQDWAEALLAQTCRAGQPTWSSSLAQTVLRRTAAVDHVFLHNPSPQSQTAWVRSDRAYGDVRDVLSDQPLPTIPGGFAVTVPGGSALWVRAAIAPQSPATRMP